MDTIHSIFSPLNLVMIAIALLIAIFANQLARMGDRFAGWLSSFSTSLRRDLRRRNWKTKRTMYLVAANSTVVTNHIARTYALFILFAGTAPMYLLLIMLGPLKHMGALPLSMQLLIYSPMLCLEVLWLYQKDRTKDLIYIAGRIEAKRAKLAPIHLRKVKRLKNPSR